MDKAREDFEKFLQYKRDGGTPLSVFVSDSVWMGGILDSWDHEPFVAIGPMDWEDESELSFFKSQDEVEQFIQRLKEESHKAFGPKP